MPEKRYAATLIESGGLYLGRAHAAANEEEDIFGLAAEDAQQAVLLLCCIVHVGCSGVGGKIRPFPRIKKERASL